MALPTARLELFDAIDQAASVKEPAVMVHAYPLKTGHQSRHPGTITIDSIVYGTLEGSDIFEAVIRVDLYAGADLELAYALGDRLLDLVDLALPKNWLKLAGWDKDESQIADEPATLTYTTTAYGHPSLAPEPGVPDYMLIGGGDRALISYAPADLGRIT